MYYIFLKLSLRSLSFRHETRHQPIRDGGSNPDFSEHIVRIFSERLNVDVVVVEGSNDHVDDADHPQVALGVALPVLTRIEEGERAKQQHREGETRQME